MQIIRDIEAFSSKEYIVASDGSFDGVHLGHRHILDSVLLGASNSGGHSMVITYSPHPRLVVDSQLDFGILSTVEEKAFLLDRMGFDFLAVIAFTKEFSKIPADEFLEQYIYGKLCVNELCIGYNHAFGNMRKGNFESAKQHGKLNVIRMDELKVSSQKVSSTIIRELICKGDVQKAVELLGHAYVVIGESMDGRRILVDRSKLLPPEGRYVAYVDGTLSEVIVDSKTLLLNKQMDTNPVIEICSRIV
ncbi:MAG: FAD synthetase family protein [Alistipes sp.]|nr:FAD synthetase family protein [Candidatus Alistipes equi]